MGKENHQYFDKSIIEVIKQRRSVRNYKSEGLSEEVKKKLEQYATGLEGPFHRKIRFHFVDASEVNGRTDKKIGTYGVIKGAPAYIAAVIEKSHRDLEELGYVFEKLILYATSLEIGTCWLGGTFTKSSFKKIVDLKENEVLPAVTPIGYIEKKKRILDTVMRMSVGANNRKPWEELFFQENFNKPLAKEEVGAYNIPLEMVRLAPSASNKQPWRIVKDDEGWHFYLDATKGYGKALGFNIQRIDMGIAMCHFEMTAIEVGLKGSWAVNAEDSKKIDIGEKQYTASWIED
ncbi:MAG: nitroreductase family protein [Clostridiaceae bacterium]|nr:nitroreductase family protein [Clostridiaceae bacterium]